MDSYKNGTFSPPNPEYVT